MQTLQNGGRGGGPASRTFGRERRGGPFIGRSPRSRAPAPRAAPGPRARPQRYLRRAGCVRHPRLPRGRGGTRSAARLPPPTPPRSPGRVFLPCKRPFPRLPPPSLQDVKWRSARRARSPRLRPIPPSRQKTTLNTGAPLPAGPSEPIHDIGAPPPPPSAAPHPRWPCPPAESSIPRAQRGPGSPAASALAACPGAGGEKHLLGPPLGCPARVPAPLPPFPAVSPPPTTLGPPFAPHAHTHTTPSPLPQWLRP